MHLTERILGFTLLGSEWVLWVLIGLSVLSVAVMVERALFFGGGVRLRRARHGAPAPPEARRHRRRRGSAGRQARARRGGGRRASRSYDRGTEAVAEAMAGAKARLRIDLERNLGVLGTLGNNAPFIGLFGTVLGIIKAFADLSRNQAGGAGGGHVGHLRGAGRHRGRPDGRHPGRHRLQLLPAPRAQVDGPRRRDGPPRAVALPARASRARSRPRAAAKRDGGT